VDELRTEGDSVEKLDSYRSIDLIDAAKTGV
jgi:hypothetical protein